MEIRPGQGGDLLTKESWGDFFLHLEFLIPEARREGSSGSGAEPEAHSGVFLHGRYEIQIIDSHGQEPSTQSCGSIPLRKAPDRNACRPPGQWQSFDISFRAPRFDGHGNVVRNPRIKVMQNGVLIHDEVEIFGTSPGGLDWFQVEEGPVMLQDGGLAVRFRNLWCQKL